MALHASAALTQTQTFRLNIAVGGFILYSPAGVKTDTVAVAPMGSRFSIIDNNADDGTTIAVRFSSIGSDSPSRTFAAFLHSRGVSSADSAAATGRSVQLPITNRQYRVPKSILSDKFYELFSGRDAGVLAVPFKFQLSEPRKVTAGGSLGAYIGYHIASFTPVVSAGLAFVSTAAPSLNNNQPPSPDTKVGFTGAFGLIVDWLSPVQIGAIVGWDLGLSKDDYAYANKPWLSISIGTGFTRH